MIEKNVIYNEDCLETMKRMEDKSVDLILTDPPYGINVDYDMYVDTKDNWYHLIETTLPEMQRVAKMIIMPSCQIKSLEWVYDNFPPDWLLCWYKGSTGHASYLGFNDWEPHLVYGRLYNNQYMHDYFQTKASPKRNTYGHPCPKPIEWADWIIPRVARENKILIYDPFFGSGTVGVSAKKHGYDWIGSEISLEYCKIAEERIRDA